MFWLIVLVFQGVLFFSTTAAKPSCSNTEIEFPIILGASIISLTATPVSTALLQPSSAAIKRTLEYCNVTILYTHPGQNDEITIQVWLPSKWNGNFYAAGGSGWETGLFTYLEAPVLKGYAAATTNGGHSSPSIFSSAEPWAQTSPGNVNLYLLQNYASVALNDLAVIGKAVITSFYSKAPKYSYWDGCSGGGRQGLMMAQRYPTTFDGVLAAAPAINWGQFIVSEYWPQVVMNEMREYPATCELEAINAAVISACDGLDGVIDGIVSAPRLCKFNPFPLVGTPAKCVGGSTIPISVAAAEVANKTWSGITTTSGKSLWYGLSHGTNLTALAGTNCTTKKENCVGVPFVITTDWIRLFVNKDPSLDVTTIGHAELARLFHASVQEYSSIIDTDDPDLTQFRQAGGKIISWHGLSDQLITPHGTSNYYERVEKLDPDIRSFYRHFEAPGVEHCFGGNGPFPHDAFNTLVRWVEGGTAPEVLKADTSLVKDVTLSRRNLCLYPLVSAYLGGGKDTKLAESYECRASF